MRWTRIASGATRGQCGSNVPPAEVPDGQISSCFPKWPVQPLLQKYFCFGLTQISSLIRAVPSQTEGRCARHQRGAGCGGRGRRSRRGRCRGRRSRVVLTPQGRRQVCEKKRRRRCQQSLVTGEITK